MSLGDDVARWADGRSPLDPELAETSTAGPLTAEPVTALPTSEPGGARSSEPSARVVPADRAPLPGPVSATPDGHTADPVVHFVAELDGIEGRPLAEHAEVYGRVHSRLQTALAEIDSA